MTKTIAIEFTLTIEGLIKRGLKEPLREQRQDRSTALRCRVVLDDDGLQAFWQAENSLGELVWCGGFLHVGDSRPPGIGGYGLSKQCLVSYALRFMTEIVAQLQSKARELPNGVKVFDLGTM